MYGLEKARRVVLNFGFVKQLHEGETKQSRSFLQRTYYLIEYIRGHFFMLAQQTLPLRASVAHELSERLWGAYHRRGRAKVCPLLR